MINNIKYSLNIQFHAQQHTAHICRMLQYPVPILKMSTFENNPACQTQNSLSADAHVEMAVEGVELSAYALIADDGCSWFVQASTERGLGLMPPSMHT